MQLPRAFRIDKFRRLAKMILGLAREIQAREIQEQRRRPRSWQAPHPSQTTKNLDLREIEV